MTNTLNDKKYLDLGGLTKFWETVSIKINEGDSTVTSALSTDITKLQTEMQENFKTVNSYTINGTEISKSPTLTGQNITLGSNIGSDADDSSINSSASLYEVISNLNEQIVTNNTDITTTFNNHIHKLNDAVVTGINIDETKFTGSPGTVEVTLSTSIITVFDGTAFGTATVNSTDVASKDHIHKYKYPKVDTATFTGSENLSVDKTIDSSIKTINSYTTSNTAIVNSADVASSDHTHVYLYQTVDTAIFTGSENLLVSAPDPDKTKEITYATDINPGVWPTFNSADVASSDHIHNLSEVRAVGSVVIDEINTYTLKPSGSVEVLNDIEITHPIANSHASVSLSTHTHNYEHKHNLNSATFKGSSSSTEIVEFSIGSIVKYDSGCLSIDFSKFNHSHQYTPEGDIEGTTDNVTGSAMTSASTSSTEVVTEISSGDWSIGTILVPTSDHTHQIILKPTGSANLELKNDLSVPTSSTTVLTNVATEGIWPTLTTASVNVALGDHTHTYTPEGSVTVNLGSEDKDTGTPSGTANIVSSITGDIISTIDYETFDVALGDHTHTYTPEGSVTVELGSEDKYTENPSGTTNIVSSITGDIISVISTTSVNVATGDHTHTYIPEGSVTVTPDFKEIYTETQSQIEK